MNLGGLSPALDVLTTRLLARPETQRLIKANPAAEVIVGADTSTAGPILLISVKAPDATEALQLRSDVSAEVLPTLKALQDELVVPDLSRISTMVLASNPEPARDGKNQLRIAIVAAAAGLGGTALMIALVDRMLSRRAAEPRRPRRHRRKGEPDLQPSDAWWADTDTDAAAVQPSGDRDDSWRGVDQGPSEKQSVGSGPARGST